MSNSVAEVVGERARSGRPWWQLCCGGCLFAILAIIVGVFILIQTLAGGGVSHQLTLPSNFPSQVVPFRMDLAQSIDYFKGENKSKMLRTIYAPIKLLNQLTGRSAQNASIAASTANGVSAFGADVRHIDSVTITWKNLQASPSEVITYYTNQFRKVGLTVSQTQNNTKEGEAVTGIEQGLFVHLALTGEAKTSVDKVVLVVSYSNKKN